MTWFPLLVACLAAVVASATDIRKFKVYNALTFPLAGLGLVYHGVVPSALGFLPSVSGLLAGFLLLIIPYAVGLLGAGDVKFLAAVGAWIGPQAILPIVLVGCIATGVFSVMLMYQQGGLRAIVNNVRFLCRLP